MSCGDPGAELCTGCAHHIRVLARPWCECCGTPTETSRKKCNQCAMLGSFDRARSLVVFVEPARRLTLHLKRRGRTSLAAAIGELAGLLARREGLVTPSTVVTWVPAGAGARRGGFDHAALLAAAVARTIGAPAAPLLRRAVDGPRQADVPLQQRRENVATRFAARRANAHVLVVDDVYTTGSTAEACAAALRTAGASSVDVVTWARTLRRRPA